MSGISDFPEEIFVLPLECAEGCLEFTKQMHERSVECKKDPEAILSENLKNVIKEKTEVYDNFMKDCGDFIDYMQVMIDTRIENITIPEQHRRIYLSLLETSLKRNMAMDIISKLMGSLGNPDDLN